MLIGKMKSSINDQTSHIPLLIGHQSKFKKGWLQLVGTAKKMSGICGALESPPACENPSASVVLLSITNILLAASPMFSHSYFLYLLRLPLS